MDGAELTIRDYLDILRRHRLLIAAVVVLTLLAGAAVSLLQTAQYESTASVLLRTARNHQLFPSVASSQQFAFQRDPQAEFEFVESSGFRSRAQAELGGDVSVSASFDDEAVTTVTRSALLEFQARSSDPSLASAAAELWARRYLDEREAIEIDNVRASIGALERQRDALELERQAILEPIKPIDDALLVEDDSDTIARLTTQRLALLQSLESELLPVQFQLRTVANDLASARITAGFIETPDISARISTTATPSRQVSPNVPRNVTLAGVLGLLLGVGAALLLDSLRTRVSNRSDVESMTSVPVLAEIPDATERERMPGGRLAAAFGAEVERVVSAVVHEAMKLDGPYRVLVASPGVGDGKSTIAAELALRLSLGRLRTALIDADLRRPVLHQRLGVSQRRTGLAELLARTGETVRTTKIGPDGPTFLAAGHPTDDAASLLRSGIDRVLDRISVGRDVVVVDSPPVLAVTDAEVIANTADGAIVVVRAGATRRSALQLTLRRLEATRAALIGIVLIGANRQDTSHGYDSRYETRPSGLIDEDATPAATMTGSSRVSA